MNVLIVQWSLYAIYLFFSKNDRCWTALRDCHAPSFLAVTGKEKPRSDEELNMRHAAARKLLQVSLSLQIVLNNMRNML